MSYWKEFDWKPERNKNYSIDSKILLISMFIMFLVIISAVIVNYSGVLCYYRETSVPFYPYPIESDNNVTIDKIEFRDHSNISFIESKKLSYIIDVWTPVGVDKVFTDISILECDNTSSNNTSSNNNNFCYTDVIIGTCKVKLIILWWSSSWSITLYGNRYI